MRVPNACPQPRSRGANHASRLSARVALLLGALALNGLAVAPLLARDASVLPGGNTKAPINIEADKLDYLDKEQKAIYSGNVVARQGDSTLRCSALSIFLDKSAAGGMPAPSDNSQITRIEAAGPVTMTSRDQVGTGDNGVYDKAGNTFVLTGHVVLRQGGNVQTGDKLTYNLTSGQAIISGGRVKGVFVPGSGKGGDSK